MQFLSRTKPNLTEPFQSKFCFEWTGNIFSGRKFQIKQLSRYSGPPMFALFCPLNWEQRPLPGGQQQEAGPSTNLFLCEIPSPQTNLTILVPTFFRQVKQLHCRGGQNTISSKECERPHLLQDKKSPSFQIWLSVDKSLLQRKTLSARGLLFF